MPGFFDKVTDMARTATDKGIEMMETTKMNSQIRSEESALNGLLQQLGKLYREKLQSGEIDDTEGEEICRSIRERETAIASLEMEIQKLKA